MLRWFFKTLLVLLVFMVSLSLPSGLYLMIPVLLSLNFFVSRNLSYQLAFVLGLLLDLAGVHLVFVSSALALLLGVKLAELFAERVFSFQNEWQDYFLGVILLTLVLNLPYCFYTLSFGSLLTLGGFLLVNLLGATLMWYLLLKFKTFYSLAPNL